MANEQKNFGLKGFAVTKRRSKRLPKYPVLARLKTGLQTDSSSDEGFPPESHRCHLKKACVKCRKQKHWDVKWHIYTFPKFRGDQGKNPLLHVLDLFDVLVECKPDDLGMHAALLIAFPHSLEGPARTWFAALTRRKMMTWCEVMDHFLKEFAVEESDCVLM